MIVLSTERLMLRNFKLSDINDMYEYASQPNVGPNAGWRPHESIEESAYFVGMFMQNEDDFAVVLKRENKVIGSISLTKDVFRFDVNAKMMGYVLSERYWGMGIMTEAAKRAIKYAFEERCLDILSVGHRVGNNRSKNVILKCGFTYEGTLRHSAKTYNNLIEDRSLYSMTRKEYFRIYGQRFKRVNGVGNSVF